MACLQFNRRKFKSRDGNSALLAGKQRQVDIIQSLLAQCCSSGLSATALRSQCKCPRLLRHGVGLRLMPAAVAPLQWEFQPRPAALIPQPSGLPANERQWLHGVDKDATASNGGSTALGSTATASGYISTALGTLSALAAITHKPSGCLCKSRVLHKPLAIWPIPNIAIP